MSCVSCHHDDDRARITTVMASPYNDDWEGADALLKSLKALATPRRPLSASKVNTVAETAIQHVKVQSLG